MREIKFRAKRLSGGDDWMYGSLVLGKRGTPTDGRAWIAPALEYDLEVDPLTVGQYAGLHDKNGKEIYEGDIVKDDAYSRPYEVRFDETPERDSDGDFYSWGYHSWSEPAELEVIGNIYENPDMLKGNGRRA